MSSENIYLVYKHTSPSGKAYIGITKDYKVRSRLHRTQPHCRAFRNAIDKYGWDTFTHEILAEGLTLDEANVYEETAIKEHNTLTPHGYNLQSGGDVFVHSAETRALMSSQRKGHITSAEQRLKISAALRGIKRTAEQRAARMGKPGTMNGRQHTPEAKAKIAEAARGRVMSQETKDKISQTLKERNRKRETE